jgi:hypothetical protein
MEMIWISTPSYEEPQNFERARKEMTVCMSDVKSGSVTWRSRF